MEQDESVVDLDKSVFISTRDNLQEKLKDASSVLNRSIFAVKDAEKANSLSTNASQYLAVLRGRQNNVPALLEDITVKSKKFDSIASKCNEEKNDAAHYKALAQYYKSFSDVLLNEHFKLLQILHHGAAQKFPITKSSNDVHSMNYTQAKLIHTKVVTQTACIRRNVLVQNKVCNKTVQQDYCEIRRSPRLLKLEQSSSAVMNNICNTNRNECGNIKHNDGNSKSKTFTNAKSAVQRKNADLRMEPYDKNFHSSGKVRGKWRKKGARSANAETPIRMSPRIVKLVQSSNAEMNNMCKTNRTVRGDIEDSGLTSRAETSKNGKRSVQGKNADLQMMPYNENVRSRGKVVRGLRKKDVQSANAEPQIKNNAVSEGLRRSRRLIKEPSPYWL